MDCFADLRHNRSMLSCNNVRQCLEKYGYVNSVVCLHSSFKSFGVVEGGPRTIIDGFLGAGNTLLAPAFCYAGETGPILENYQQNGTDYADRQFSPVSYQGRAEQIDATMGIIPKLMLTYRNSFRSTHPTCSFVAIGPLAEALTKDQENLNVYSAYKQLMSQKEHSYIFHCGTDLTTCTPLHFAEALAGRTLFRRWAIHQQKIEEVEVGGCSTGFENMRPFFKNKERNFMLGESPTAVFIFREFIEQAVRTLSEQPEITRCSSHCMTCNDIIAGGPLRTGKA